MNFVRYILDSLIKIIGYLIHIFWHIAGYQNRALADTESDESSRKSSTEEVLEDGDSSTKPSTIEDSETVDNSTISPVTEDLESDDRSTTTTEDLGDDDSSTTSTTDESENDDNSTRSSTAEDVDNGDNSSRSTTEDGDIDDNSTTSPTTEDLESDNRSITYSTTGNSVNEHTTSPTIENTEDDDNFTRSLTIEITENDDNSTRTPIIEITENDDNSTRLASADNIQPPHLEIDSYEYYRSVNSGLLAALTECNICLEPLQRGAHACARCGGMWCFQCASELSKCVWCRYELNNQQSSVCHALDKLLVSLKLPCRNQRNGCPKMLTLAERNLHETQYCEKEPVFCPFTIACQGLNFGEIADHMRDVHNAIIVNNLTVTIPIIIIPNKLPSFDEPYALISNKNVFILELYFHENRVKIDVGRKSLSDPTETDTAIRYFANIYVKQGIWSWDILDRVLEPVNYTTITVLLGVDFSRKHTYTICFEIKELDDIPENVE